MPQYSMNVLLTECGLTVLFLQCTDPLNPNSTHLCNWPAFDPVSFPPLHNNDTYSTAALCPNFTIAFAPAPLAQPFVDSVSGYLNVSAFTGLFFLTGGSLATPVFDSESDAVAYLATSSNNAGCQGAVIFDSVCVGQLFHFV